MIARFRPTGQPSAEPVTIGQARAQMRLDDGADDALVLTYLIAARQWCEQHLGRPIMPTPVRAELEDWPTRGPLVLDAPIISITSVNATGPDEQTASWDGYVLRPAAGGTSVLRPAAGADWPPLGPDWMGTIDAVAGFDGLVPEPICLAILQLAAHWYAAREPVAMGQPASLVPITARDLLRPFRWRLIG